MRNRFIDNLQPEELSYARSTRFFVLLMRAFFSSISRNRSLLILLKEVKQCSPLVL